MKRQNFYSLALKATAVAFLLGGASAVNAQDLLNDTDGKIQNTGTIKFKTTGAKFTNNAPIADQTMDSGVVEINGGSAIYDGSVALGSSTTNRFPGLVRWNGDTVQDLDAIATGQEYYTNLELAGDGTKSVPDSVFVGGTYNVADTTGDRTYAGTFFYDGEAQRIFAETGLNGNENRYNNLNLQGTGLKSLIVGDATSLLGTLENLSGAPLTVGGRLSVGGAANMADIVTIDSSDTAAFTTSTTDLATFSDSLMLNQGNFNVEAGGARIATSALFAIANDSTAVLNVADSSDLTVSGIFTNAYAAATNLNFSATSNTIYDGTSSQELVATVGTHPYGNLTTDSSEKTVAGDVYVATNLSVSGGNLDVLASTNELFLTDGDASYSDSSEVRGKMTRAGSFTDTGILLAADSTSYTYNNPKTVVQFTSGTRPASFSIDARAATAPLQYDSTTDVNRRLIVAYTGTSTDWNASIQAGYKPSDIPSNWLSTTSESTLRYMESDDDAIEKLATGQTYTRDTTAQYFHSVQLAGIMPTTDEIDGSSDKFVKDGNDLLLRGGPTIFYAISSGRWSNPGTWDEGEQPGKSDVAVINGYMVHAGYEGRSDGAVSAGQIAEAHPDSLAARIYVGAMDSTGTTQDSTGLLFGQISGQTSRVASFSLTPGGSITNRAGSSAAAIVGLSTATPDTGTDPIEGLIIYAGSAIQANNLVNEGRIGNAGEIEVGDD